MEGTLSILPWWEWKLEWNINGAGLWGGACGFMWPVAYRGGWFGMFKPPPPKFRRYRWSPWSREQEEPASRFPFV